MGRSRLRVGQEKLHFLLCISRLPQCTWYHKNWVALGLGDCGKGKELHFFFVDERMHDQLKCMDSSRANEMSRDFFIRGRGQLFSPTYFFLLSPKYA